MRTVTLLATQEGVSGAEVGFKAARLAEMMRLGLPVPAGCVIAVQAFTQFCAENGIQVGRIPVEHAVKLIKAGAFSTTLLDELEENMAALPIGPYAVRSSALAEDGKSYSMAGQLVTHLNVRKEDVPERVKDCWIGMFGRAVTAYASRNRISQAQQMGVIVQQQVAARYSGVLFTLDPITSTADQLEIEWVEGSGEQLVSGAVTPERVYMSRRHPEVPNELPEELRQNLTQLVEYALQAERHFNCPLDVEWCSDSTGVFLLQARPVTAVGEQDAIVWTNTNMSENFPKPLTPFAWSVVEEFYKLYLLNLARILGIRDPQLHMRQSLVNRLTGVQCGRVYYNIKSWYRLLGNYLPALAGVLGGYLNNYIDQRVPVDLGDDDKKVRGGGRRTAGLLRQISFWCRLVFYLTNARNCLKRFERMFLSFRRELRRPSYLKLTPARLVAKMDALFDNFVTPHWYHQGIADFSMLLFPGILNTLVARWVPARFGDSAQVSARLMQHKDLASTDSARIIARMAQAIGERPTLARLLDEGDYQALEDRLPTSSRVMLDDFLERFGSRCYHECLIVSPTFDERHDLFWELVKKYWNGEETWPQDRGDARNDDEIYMEEVLSALQPGKRLVIASAAKRARSAIALREQGRLVQSMLFGEIRKIALALGERLADLGHLSATEDVFFLQLSEVRDLCYGKFLLPETLPQLIAMRREGLEQCDELEPPECFVLEHGVYWKERVAAVPPIENGVLRGTGASRGNATGRARVIFDPISDNRLLPGDILVARSTDPGWTPLFLIAGGLILERGGMLSHGAIVAREFGIPVVVGVEGATKLIADGARVSVDGQTGEVVILEDSVDDVECRASA